jgi:hypothetical protein
MNNNPSNPQPSFSDDNSATFLIRWRGRQEGPYTAEVIQTKLAANQIGLLHELFHQGQWISLRAYLDQRDEQLRMEQEAIAEQERLKKEQTERRAREREEELKLAEQTEANRNLRLVQTTQTLTPSKPASQLSRIYGLLLKTVCLVSFLAFFLPNITVSVPIYGKVDVSMFDLLTSRATNSKTSPDKPPKPSIDNLGEMKLSKLTIGPAICLLSLLALLFHYATTAAWIILTFGFRKQLSLFNTVWLCLGLQFPILFSIGVHMTLATVRNDLGQQSAQSDSDPIGTLFGMALVNNTSVGPGVVMWVLMALAALAVGINAIQQPSHTHE